MATYSSTLAWEISWMEEPGRLQSMGLQRARHDWATSFSLFHFSVMFRLYFSMGFLRSMDSINLCLCQIVITNSPGKCLFFLPVQLWPRAKQGNVFIFSLAETGFCFVCLGLVSSASLPDHSDSLRVWLLGIINFKLYNDSFLGQGTCLLCSSSVQPYLWILLFFRVEGV